MVLLENHSPGRRRLSYGLWYGQAGYDEDDWVASVAGARPPLRDRPNVIGADLKNEPHGDATWGTGGSDRLAAGRRARRQRRHGARAGLAHRRRGHREAVAGERLDGTGGAATSRASAAHAGAPQRADRLVYSPHEYGPGVFPQPWFGRRTPADAARAALARRLGLHRRERDRAAAASASSAGARSTLGSDEGRWQRQFLDHLGRTGISWTYWALNPDSGDTGGVLRDDWTTPDATSSPCCSGRSGASASASSHRRNQRRRAAHSLSLDLRVRTG